MTGSIGNLFIDIIARTAEFTKGVAQTQKDLRKLGMDMTAAGQVVTAGLTVPLVGAGAAIIKMGSDFESGFAGVRKTVDATEEQFAGLSEGFRELAKEIPLSTDEILKIGEAAGQLGIETENILSFTRVMADLGVTTNLSSDQAATALARLANVTGLPQEQFSNLGSAVVALGNNMATTEAEIVEFGSRIASAGSQVGLSEAEILGFGAALSSVNLEAEAGGTAISKVFINIATEVATGGEKLAKFAEIAGMTTADFSAAFREDAAGAVIAFIEGLGAMDNQSGETFLALEDLGMTEVRLRDAMLRAAGASDLLKTAVQLSTTEFAANTALTKEAEQRYATFESQVKLLWAAVRDLGIELFTSLRPILVDQIIPAVASAIEVVSVLAGWFTALPQPVQTVVVALAALAAAIGPVLLAVGAMALGLSGLLPIITGVIAILSGPVGIIIAVAAVAAALLAWLSTNETVQEGLEKVWNGIKELISGVLESLEAVYEKYADIFLRIWAVWGDEITTSFEIIWTSISNTTKLVFDVIASILEAAFGVMGGLVQVFAGLFLGDWELMGDGIKTIWESLWGAVSGIFESFVTFLSAQLDQLIQSLNEEIARIDTMWRDMAATMQSIWETLWTTVKNFINSPLDSIKSLISSFASAVSSTWSSFTDSIRSMWESLWNGIKSFITGPIDSIKSKISDFTSAVSGFFGDMYDDVVGNSFVPDMMEGIKGQFGRLDSEILPGLDLSLEGIGGLFSDLASKVIPDLDGIIGKMKGLFDGTMFEGLGGLKDAFGGIVDSVKGAVSSIGDFVKGLGEIFAGGGWAGFLGGAAGGLVGGLVGGIGSNENNHIRAIEEHTRYARIFWETYIGDIAWPIRFDISDILHHIAFMRKWGMEAPTNALITMRDVLLPNIQNVLTLIHTTLDSGLSAIVNAIVDLKAATIQAAVPGSLAVSAAGSSASFSALLDPTGGGSFLMGSGSTGYTEIKVAPVFNLKSWDTKDMRRSVREDIFPEIERLVKNARK